MATMKKQPPKSPKVKKSKIAPTTVPVPSAFAGVFQPMFQHRFYASMIVGMDNCPEISREVVSVKYDLAKKTGSMVVQIPIVGNGVVSKLNRAMSGCTSIIIEATDGRDTVCSSVGLCNLEFTKCELVHDYALGGAVHADIEFNFKTIITTTGVDGSERIIENSVF